MSNRVLGFTVVGPSGYKLGGGSRMGRSMPLLGAVVTMLVCSIAVSHAADAVPADADSSPPPRLEEVVVTARKRDENLQNVPDAVTAFTAETIENAGIRHIADFLALTPNLNFEDGSAYYSGFLNLSMRGIGNGQDGWPSVAYLVDGVPADSTDSINSGSLEDIERIEVLRGPQSALYGSGAIAGAINVVTQRPTNEFQFKGRVSSGNGNDEQMGATVSGPIIPDTLLFRLTASYRNDGGLLESPSNRLGLDFIHQTLLQGRLIFKPAENFEMDLHASLDTEHNGSGYEDEVPSVNYMNDFSPQYNARRGYAGYEDRQLARLALRMQFDIGPVSLISVTGFSHVNQYLNSSFCFDDPSDPLYPAPGGGAQCLFGTAFGRNAGPGEPIDEFAAGPIDFRTVTQDVRVASRDNERINWILGASGMTRRALEGTDYGSINAPDSSRQLFLSQYDLKRDDWWGVYGQLSAKITPKVELSFAGRLDDTDVKNTGYTDYTLSTPVPVFSGNGTLIDTPAYRTTNFQPKGQFSYHFTDDIMSYLTVSRGFRAGFFNYGQYTIPEHTTNYEVGVKSVFWDHRMTANLAIFYIDYSDQQFETFTNTPPYSIAVTIPKTKIKGAEYETTLAVTTHLTVGTALGYLDAKLPDGTFSPASPRFNASATVDFGLPLSTDWSWRLHLDDRYNSSLYLSTEDTQEVSPKNYLNARAGVDKGNYSFNLFVRNATNTRQSTLPGAELVAGFVRYQNEPRSYGGEFRVAF
jgi:iron complex outermembrane recepter protein